MSDNKQQEMHMVLIPDVIKCQKCLLKLVGKIHECNNTVGSIIIRFQRDMLHDYPVKIVVHIDAIQSYHCVTLSFEGVEIVQYLLTKGTLFTMKPRSFLSCETFFNAMIRLEDGSAWDEQAKLVISNGGMFHKRKLKEKTLTMESFIDGLHKFGQVFFYNTCYLHLKTTLLRVNSTEVQTLVNTEESRQSDNWDELPRLLLDNAWS